MAWHAEIKLYGKAGNPATAPVLLIERCDDPTPDTGARKKDGTYDLYCLSCDRTFAVLYPKEEGV